MKFNSAHEAFKFVLEQHNYKLSASVRWGIWGKYPNIKPILAIFGC